MSKIQRCVFSYFNPEGFSNTGGFISFRDMLFSTALSCIVAKNHFKETVLYTNTYWSNLLKELGFPYDDIYTTLDNIEHVNKYFWAYGKIYTYALQTTPFVHIDNDVFLWNGLPSKFDDAQLIFQSKEPIYDDKYGYYNQLRTIYEDMPVRADIKLCMDYAFNCGICGGTNLDVFREHLKVSGQYIFAPENQHKFFIEYKDMIIHQNLMHEQYFLSSIIKNMKLRSHTKTLNDDVWKINNRNYKYTHIWGCSKRHYETMVKVRNRVKEFDPNLHDVLSCFDVRDYTYNPI